ncbi:hypothetical protein PF050_11480 [Kosakonia pseudosacchari]|uniref:hypothetical protein n=1 Tax=Kosakonia pseudosacchari TaxID=1646340 RepID=UPI00135644A1|nr:hypothetical protein [Kosakonia pseudosacchari]WBU51493.1 hypothetical protein PF050_11480 [Kosakonia pseudosacchari]
MNIPFSLSEKRKNDSLLLSAAQVSINARRARGMPPELVGFEKRRNCPADSATGPGSGERSVK